MQSPSSSSKAGHANRKDGPTASPELPVSASSSLPSALSPRPQQSTPRSSPKAGCAVPRQQSTSAIYSFPDVATKSSDPSSSSSTYPSSLQSSQPTSSASASLHSPHAAAMIPPRQANPLQQPTVSGPPGVDSSSASYDRHGESSHTNAKHAAAAAAPSTSTAAVPAATSSPAHPSASDLVDVDLNARSQPRIPSQQFASGQREEQSAGGDSGNKDVVLDVGDEPTSSSTSSAPSSSASLSRRAAQPLHASTLSVGDRQQIRNNKNRRAKEFAILIGVAAILLGSFIYSWRMGVAVTMSLVVAILLHFAAMFVYKTK